MLIKRVFLVVQTRIRNGIYFAMNIFTAYIERQVINDNQSLKSSVNYLPSQLFKCKFYKTIYPYIH